MDEYIQKRTENNAGLIYKADFYPIYTQRLGKGLSAEELIILSFVYYWTKNGSYIYASNEELAEMIGASSRTVKKFIKRLVDLSYIEVVSKTIVGMGTDRRMRYVGKIDGGEKISLPGKGASEAESIGGEKISLPNKSNPKAESIGGEKISLPGEENKFLGGTSENLEKSQKNRNPSEGKKFPPYKNNIKDLILFTEEKLDDSNEPSQGSEMIEKTKLSDSEFAFNDGSIEYYTKLTLQQTKLEDVTNILWPLFPHPRGYKGAKKDVVKALKQHTLDYDFVYGLIYDMKLLGFLCEYNLVRRPGFMGQRVDTYTPYTEEQRNDDLVRIVTYIKRNNQDKSLFERRVKEVVDLCGLEKYRKIFRSIPANIEDRVDLSRIK